MALQEEFNILENKEIKNNIYKMVFKASSVYQKALPGQFIHVRCSKGYKPLLRRPFSIYKVKSEKVSIIYKVVGEGTFCLSKFKPDDKIDVLGPLGNNFSLPTGKEKIFFIAGGMGIAPISFLIDFFVEKKVKMIDNGEVIFGVKKSKDLILENELKIKENIELHLVTEDGKKGKKGTVIEVFKSLIKKGSCLVYASGPVGMFKSLNELCESNGIPAQVSYENFMGCGVGACLGCVIKTKDGQKRVCKDGPIFQLDKMVWR